jgi:putative copper resistance protein D
MFSTCYVRPVCAMMAALFIAFSVIYPPVTWSQSHAGHHHMPNMPEMNNTDGTPVMNDTHREAKRLSDKRESEMNHHIAGFLVAMAGVFVLLECLRSGASSRLRLLGPLCFLLVSLFLFIFSDTEIWPFGPQSVWHAVTHDLEALQHKTFALILLAMGIVEYQRVRGRWNGALTPWIFSIAGLAGAILLLFHRHTMDMHHVAAMQQMQHIEVQHRWYAAVGVGIVTAKHVSEFPTKWQKLFTIVWPALMITLGLSLVFYTE